jgi:type VI secretion system protein ImpF
MSGEQIERMVKGAILQFESRIIRSSLHVKAIEAARAVGNVLSVEIRADVWATPMPESLYVKTQVDLETGQCSLQDQLHT